MPEEPMMEERVVNEAIGEPRRARIIPMQPRAVGHDYDGPMQAG